MKYAMIIAVAITVITLAHIPGEEVVYQAPQKIKTLILAEISAYTASKDETDSRPWEMASGKKVYMGAIACPGRIPFGTRVLIGERTYICEDRMNARYRNTDHFDIFVSTKAEAFEFGRQQLEVTIIQ